jgi:hypothetical protein
MIQRGKECDLEILRIKAHHKSSQGLSVMSMKRGGMNGSATIRSDVTSHNLGPLVGADQIKSWWYVQVATRHLNEANLRKNKFD